MRKVHCDWRPFALLVMHNLWLPAAMSAFAEALVRVMLLLRAVSFAVFLLRGVRGALRAAAATPRTWPRHRRGISSEATGIPRRDDGACGQ